VVNVAAPPSDLALVAAGAEWRPLNGWSVLAKFEGELANRSETYIGTARVKYAWRRVLARPGSAGRQPAGPLIEVNPTRRQRSRRGNP
jgi:hypothetical protein